MSVIDDYLQKIEPTKRAALERIRLIAKQIVPDVEETIGYGMPTLKYQGKGFLGFDVHKEHIGIYPYSGEVTEALRDKLDGYTYSSGAIQVPYDKPISEELLKEIISYRINMITGQK